MRHIFILLFILTVLFACQSSEPNTKRNSDKGLEHLLFDIQTARVAIEKSDPQLKDSLSQVYFKQIMELHGLSQEEMDKTVQFIYHNPEVIDSLYINMTGVLDSLKGVIRYRN